MKYFVLLIVLLIGCSTTPREKYDCSLSKEGTLRCSEQNLPLEECGCRKIRSIIPPGSTVTVIPKANLKKERN